ncbi:PREDICTED: uncharacterized protein LOC108753728 [Trachymyrmex septentrionalis]|uniref:uncharacterized protein LOC108753728 n=1 Tax=Trachymyrmex septentrionalis TaxID=34720 RepID=UPI00084F0060|nr:PREDICTED: uncharacterized protein LOC108753728 [Trachymyrmex septentrionalis]
MTKYGFARLALWRPRRSMTSQPSNNQENNPLMLIRATVITFFVFAVRLSLAHFYPSRQSALRVPGFVCARRWKKGELEAHATATRQKEGEGGGGGGGGGGGRSVTGSGGGGGGGGGRRAPSLRLVNGRATTGVSLHTSSTESVRSPHHQQVGNNNCHAGNNPAANNHPRLNKDDSIKISIENTNTCTDSLVTALDDETLLITDFLGDTDVHECNCHSVVFAVKCHKSLIGSVTRAYTCVIYV